MPRSERPRRSARSAPTQADLGPVLVTSTFGAASAVLFVVDPVTGTLASYEATPGESGGLRLLGARRIDYDLRLTRYKDQSEFSFSELRDQYEAGDGDPSERVPRMESASRRGSHCRVHPAVPVA